MFMNVIFINLLYVLEALMFHFCPDSLREKNFLSNFILYLCNENADCWIH